MRRYLLHVHELAVVRFERELDLNSAQRVRPATGLGWWRRKRSVLLLSSGLAREEIHLMVEGSRAQKAVRKQTRQTSSQVPSSRQHTQPTLCTAFRSVLFCIMLFQKPTSIFEFSTSVHFSISNCAASADNNHPSLLSLCFPSGWFVSLRRCLPFEKLWMQPRRRLRRGCGRVRRRSSKRYWSWCLPTCSAFWPTATCTLGGVKTIVASSRRLSSATPKP
jgi:hypothetical protein